MTLNFGFAIDTRSCIGCHACSTACKSENQVPLGVNRTWVKYTEIGVYPDARRAFQVTRCNHCQNPPCVRICPVEAMYQKDNGIVEFDGDVCIGCKACMQACPYDAIYIDPDSGTAAKCHYCGHRVENGLEPACVVVCPTHSIIAGDLDDPQSEITRVLGKNDATVRKPEQGTAPKVFYISGNQVSLHPTALLKPESMIFADVADEHQGDHNPYVDQAGGLLPTVSHRNVERTERDGIRIPETQGLPAGGPIQTSPARMAEHMVQVAYNAQHEVPWHWPVPTYLVTKGIGAGAFLMLAIAALFLGLPEGSGVGVAIGAIGVLATLATTALLVIDLERPERFLRIVFRPQWKSWLARGAYILISFSMVTSLWWAFELFTWLGWMATVPARGLLAVLTIPLAIGAAVYTAFLFAQCEGRDLWQSPLLPFHLLLHAAMLGAGSVLCVDALAEVSTGLATMAWWTFAASLVLDLFVLLVGEFTVPHASEIAGRAAHAITHGVYRNQFWIGAIVIGHLLPLALLATGVPFLGGTAAVAAMIGVLAYEFAYVMAPQQIPNS